MSKKKSPHKFKNKNKKSTRDKCMTTPDKSFDAMSFLSATTKLLSFVPQDALHNFLDLIVSMFS